MSTITSAQTGYYDVGSTWVGGVTPSATDRIVVDTLHSVTCRNAETIGDSPDPAADVVTVLGSLLWALGGSLTARGNVKIWGTVNIAYGRLVVDNSLAPTVQYTIEGVYQTGILTSSAAAEAGRGYINSSATGIPATITGSRISLNYTTIDRIGSASVRCIDSIANAATDYLYLRYCKLNNCGMTAQNFTPSADTPFDFFHTSWTNTAADVPLRTNGSTGRASYCSFDKIVNFYPAANFTIDHIIFQQGFDFAGASPATFDDLFINRSTSNSILADPGPITCNRAYFVAQNGGHFINGAASLRLKYWLFEAAFITAGYKENDLVPANSGFNGTCYLDYCISLPNSLDSTASSGCLGSMLGNSTTKYELDHCTEHVGSEGSGVAGGGTNIGESYSGTAGMLPIKQSCLAWTDTVNGGGLVNDIGGSTVPNVATNAGLRNNGKFNLFTGVGGVNGYNLSPGGTGTPGVNDVTGDPQFVDKTRNLAKWDLSLGGPGTVVHALAQMAKLNDTDFDTRYTFTALHTYVIGGFAPQNVIYKNAGYDNITIGAIEGVWPATPSRKRGGFVGAGFGIGRTA